MAQLSKSAYEALYGTSGTTFPDNTSGDIGANDVRQLGKDSADSAMFILDNFIDEDDMASNSATKAPSQQSVKAFVEATSVVSGVYNGYVTVDSADVLTANGTPITLVAAPGTDNVIVPIFPIAVHLDYQSAAYATNLGIRVEINGVALSATDSSILAATADSLAYLNGATLGATALSTLKNQALVLKVQSGNPTAGDSPIAIKFSYRIMDCSNLI
jgi:hypothetical protein